MMDEDRYQINQTAEPNPLGALTRMVGFLCIAFGIVIGLWLFFKVTAFINDPASLEHFGRLLTEPVETIVNTPDKDIQTVIPTEAVGYFLLVLLFGITIKIAGVFLSAGAKLLDRDTQTCLNKLSKAQMNIVNKLDNIKTAIKNKT